VLSLQREQASPITAEKLIRNNKKKPRIRKQKRSKGAHLENLAKRKKKEIDQLKEEEGGKNLDDYSYIKKRL